jgi:hypothetical protein
MVVAAVVHLVLGAAVVSRLLWAPGARAALQQSPQPCLADWEAST